MVRWLMFAVMGGSALLPGLAGAAEPAKPTAPAKAPQDVLLDKIGAKYSPVDVITASFVQITKSAYGEEKVEGTVLLKRPGQMRWNFADGRQFVSDGSTLWIYTPSEKRVQRIPGFGEQAASANDVLQSMHKLREMFDVVVVSSDPKAGHVLDLTPKGGQDAQFQKLQLALDKDLLLDKVVVTDAFGTQTVLDFAGLTLGGKTQPTDFQFQVPPGVTVENLGG